MNINFLKKLSNADSIASNEKEVRDILVDELKEFSDDIYCDNIGCTPCNGRSTYG